MELHKPNINFLKRSQEPHKSDSQHITPAARRDCTTLGHTHACRLGIPDISCRHALDRHTLCCSDHGRVYATEDTGMEGGGSSNLAVRVRRRDAKIVEKETGIRRRQEGGYEGKVCVRWEGGLLEVGCCVGLVNLLLQQYMFLRVNTT
jgi:hypothetical protein